MKVGHLYGTLRQARFGRQGDFLRSGGHFNHRAPMLLFQPLGFGNGNSQTARDIVGDMIAANPERPRRGNRAVRVHDVIRRAASQVDDHAAGLLVLGRQHRQGRAKPSERHILHIHLHAPDDLDDIPQAHEQSVDDQHVRGQLGPLHAFGIDHAFLVIHVEVLADRVQDLAVRRQADRASGLHHVIDIRLRDLLSGVHDRHAAAIYQARDVASGDHEMNLVDDDPAVFLREPERFADTRHGVVEIDNLALAHAAGGTLPQARDHEVAVGPRFTDHGANHGRSNFQGNNQRKIHNPTRGKSVTGTAPGSSCPRSCQWRQSPDPCRLYVS